jgi:hypothetical protein
MAWQTGSEHWLADAGVAAAVAAAPIARMAVSTPHGPLVSSLLHASSGGRLWMVSSRRSAHVRVIARRPDVGIVLRSGLRSVVIAGTAQVLGPWGPREALRLSVDARGATEAVLGYAVRNSARLAGYVADMVRLPPKPETLPFDRVLIAVTPQRGFVATGATVSHVHGDWPGDPEVLPLWRSGGGRSMEARPELPDGIPPWVASIVDGRQACTIGWDDGEGPLALPGTWDPGTWGAELALSVVGLVAPRRRVVPACLALDRSVAFRPSSYSGLVLRGRGRLEAPSEDSRSLRLALATERVSWWSGFDKGTVRPQR